MNPLAIRATNLRTFETLDLELPNGCTVIGGQNGAGKSTILNAIDVALFAGRGELAPLLSLGEDELELTLEFEHAGELYRVRRRFSAKGRGKATLDLERYLVAPEHSGDDRGPGWVPLTRETIDATDDLLADILGLSRATFRASSFLAQGDGAAFTEAKAHERKEILAEVLGLGVWDELEKRARADRRQVEDEIVALHTQITTLEVEAEKGVQVKAELADANAALAEARERKIYADGILDRAQQAVAGNAAAAERLRGLEAEGAAAIERFETAKKAVEAAELAAEQRVTKQAELEATAALADRVPALEIELEASRAAMVKAVRRQDIRRQLLEREEANARRARNGNEQREQANALAEKAAHLEAHIGESASCDRCGQTLGAEAAARAIASYRAEASEIQARVAVILREAEAELEQLVELAREADAIVVDERLRTPEVVEENLTLARDAGVRRATIAEQLRHIAVQAGGLEDHRAAMRAAGEAVTAASTAIAEQRELVVDERQLQRDLEEARSRVAEISELVDERKAAIVRLQVAEQRAQAAAEELASAGTGIELAQGRLDLLKLAERAYGRDGIPALIVENAAIPQLEIEANRILGELGGATADCRVELRTQRALKTSEALRETLDIVIVTPTGERPYETFSGGERTRLNLALRIALARLLAHRRGAESRLLAIDEPEFLDEAGVSRLADVLRGLAGDFDRVLLVSHHPTLAASFDQAITVVKDGDRSRVDVDALEAVAA